MPLAAWHMASDHLLLRTLRGDAVERPPVWAMRQAGRWDPEFNKLRSGLSFFEFSENVELAVKASLLPRRFGVDAIILFYDITTLTVAMGLPFTLQQNQRPVPERSIREMEDVRRLEERPATERFGHTVELLRGAGQMDTASRENDRCFRRHNQFGGPGDTRRIRTGAQCRYAAIDRVTVKVRCAEMVYCV